MQLAHSTTDVHSACELMMTIAHCDDDTMLILTPLAQQMRKLTFSSCCAFLRVMHERLRHFICILNSSNDFFYDISLPVSLFPPVHLLSISGNIFSSSLFPFSSTAFSQINFPYFPSCTCFDSRKEHGGGETRVWIWSSLFRIGRSSARSRYLFYTSRAREPGSFRWWCRWMIIFSQIYNKFSTWQKTLIRVLLSATK